MYIYVYICIYIYILMYIYRLVFPIGIPYWYMLRETIFETEPCLFFLNLSSIVARRYY